MFDARIRPAPPSSREIAQHSRKLGRLLTSGDLWAWAKIGGGGKPRKMNRDGVSRN